MPDPILDLATEWRANNPARARTHRPLLRGNAVVGWYIDGDTPITPGPASLAGGYTIPGPTAAQLAHGAPTPTPWPPTTPPFQPTGLGILPPAYGLPWASDLVDGGEPHTSVRGHRLHSAYLDEFAVIDERTDADVAALLEEARSYNWGVDLHLTKPSEPPAPAPVDEPVIPAAHAQSLTARAAAFLRSLLDEIAATLRGH